MRALARGASETARVLLDQPLVGAVVVATGVLAGAGAVVAGQFPVIGGIAYLLLQPMVFAGLLHVGNTPADGSVSGRTYVDGVRRYTMGLLGTGLLTGVVFALLGCLAFFVVFMVGFTGAIGLTAGLVVAAAPVAVMAIALQFVDASVVVDGDGVRGAVEHSWEVLAHHPVSVLGYTAVRAVCLGLLAAVVALSFGEQAVLPSIGSGTARAALPAVGCCLAGYLGVVAHVTVYRQLRG
ncbi:hypothetical protein [Haloarcula montana]|uniref:DUF7847 domain-containing protein n=1 Tax=Haloarcula montana TaxID=3111776 RepID=UPI002D79D954|nr:hypothetical protein [Haloarcula sp. GH36]